MILWARHKGNLWLSRPRWLFGGLGLKNIPAVPFDLSELLETIPKLLLRQAELRPAKDALDNSYTIDGITRPALDFMYDDERLGGVVEHLETFESALASSPRRMGESFRTAFAELEEELETPHGVGERLTDMALDEPSQFSMSWTNQDDVYADAVGKGFDKKWGAALTDPRRAEELFWRLISEDGLGYNLLVLEKVTDSSRARSESSFPDGWPSSLEEAFGRGGLYVIDMSIFEHVQTTRAGGLDRFTPSTTTWLSQDQATKALTPIAVRVSKGAGPSTFFGPDDPAWLYALQAARTSITVWGIWLGHVYHWHIVTAAMQMTMYNTIPDHHMLFKLVAPQSKYLIAFDDLLLLLWKSIAPPTSLTGPRQFLELCDRFATGRSFFDDDPRVTLERSAIREADFTVSEPWDRFPIAGQLLYIWDATEKYVSAFVNTTYPNDQAVAQDSDLRKWMKASSSRWQGNVRGLPSVDTRSALIRVLTSLIYRVTAHGNARLLRSINPVATFVANYPPCLQRTDIPKPSDTITTAELLDYSPRTGTIGGMVSFYFIFTFSQPYEPFISNRLFFGDNPQDPRNLALKDYRTAMTNFMKTLDPKLAELRQWPLNIET